MQRACELARKQLGQTWPNPSVGAVIVKDNEVIGEGATARGGRPHAETQAIAQAGENARGATLYVSLEPCAHHGKTPPCADAIISAGIARVVVACRDPHREHGGGIEKLRAAGIEVTLGVCEAEARDINRGFISVVERNRPYVALKIATSADGRIAGGPGRWITGEAARGEVHRLRAEFDAVLTGIGTVLADDPMLTVRSPGLEDRSPVRVVLDRQHRLPAQSKLAQSQHDAPLWVLDANDIAAALAELTGKGITRLLVEAGQGINTAFWNAGVIDRVYWFKAPHAIGENGLSAFKNNVLEQLANWRQVEHTAFPPDTLDILECSPAS